MSCHAIPARALRAMLGFMTTAAALFGAGLSAPLAAQNVFPATGNVGIGTTAPLRALHIQGTGDVEIALQSVRRHPINGRVSGRLWTLQASGNSGGPLDGSFQIVDRSANVARLFVFPDGVVSVGVLKITGGSDLAEPFAVVTDDLAPGTVVSIDVEHPGALRRSDRAYDSRVAGVISGANGLAPGLVMHDSSLGRTGQHVALSGRVYVQADATHRPIRPGDLLTTSDIPGLAMTVEAGHTSQGSVLGKAMTGLATGRGTVLLLVSLQ